MKKYFTMEIFKCFTMKDDVHHVLYYNNSPTDKNIWEIAQAWEDAGYTVKSVTQLHV